MNRMKCEIFKIWARLPDGLRRKPLDFEVAVLLIFSALAAINITPFDPFKFLFADSPLTDVLEMICITYMLLGGLFLIIGLLTHHRHGQLLSYCKLEMWAWRLIFSTSLAMFIAEFFFGVIPGISIGSLLWLLQSCVAMLKLFQYYNEKLKEQKLWTS